MCWEFFFASRCSAVAILFIRLRLLVNPFHLDRRCVSGGQNLRFACAGPQKMHLGSSKFAFRLRETLGRSVFPAQGHTKRVSGGQNLRFAQGNAPADLGRTVFPAQGHTKRVSGGQNLRFACAGAQNRMLRMLRHESGTWILQSFLRYIWMLRHGSGVMDLAEDPEIQRC